MGMNNFETSDLYLAAALKIHNFKLVNLQRSGGRAVFIFEDRPDREAMMRQYFSGELTGSLKIFISVLSDLRSMINQMGMSNERKRERE